MTAPEPTRERVEAYEAALGCEKRRWHHPGGHTDVCSQHGGHNWTALGCPVAVAAARVEAEHVRLWKDPLPQG